MADNTDNPFNGRGAAEAFIKDQLGEEAFSDEDDGEEFGWEPSAN